MYIQMCIEGQIYQKSISLHLHTRSDDCTCALCMVVVFNIELLEVYKKRNSDLQRRERMGPLRKY